MNDFRYAYRMLLKHPGSNAVVVITLGLVIGTLGLALGVLKHERAAWIPFHEPSRMVRLWRLDKERPLSEFPASVYAELRRQSRGMESIAAIGWHQQYSVTGRGDARSVTGLEVSAGVFRAAGMQPLLGRTFTPEEEQAGDSNPIVISHSVWQEIFGGEPSVVGSTMSLNQTLHTVVGVMPKGADHNALFYGMDVWLPGRFESPAQGRSWIEIVGRLKPGVSVGQIQAELEAIGPALEGAYGDLRPNRDAPARIAAYPIDKNFSRVEPGAVVFAAVIPLFVVLIACFNVANVLLARLASRRREIAVRFSLGARRARVIRQLLTEGVLLALCGGLLGLVMAIWIAEWSEPRGIEAQFSPAVVGAVLAAAAAIGLGVGWTPAIRATRGDLAAALKDGGGAPSGGIERHRLRNFLVGSQVAMAMVLCVAAGLLVRSYVNKKRFNPGFDTGRLVFVAVSPGNAVYDTPEKRWLYCEQALDRLRSVPGLAEVGVASTTRWIEGHFQSGSNSRATEPNGIGTSASM